MKTILLFCLHLAFAAYQGDTYQTGGYQSQANGEVREECLECAQAFESSKKLCKMALKKKWYQVKMPGACLNKMHDKSGLNCRNDVINRCKATKKLVLSQYQQQSPMGSPYQQPGVEVYADNMGSEVETEWERCIEAIADLQLQQTFDHLGDPTHLEKQTAAGILTFRFRDGFSATFQENGPGMLPSLQSCNIPPGSAVQVQCVPQPPQPEFPPQGPAQADQQPQYPSGRPGMSQARPQGQPPRQPPMRPGSQAPVKPGYQPHQQSTSSHLSPSQQKEMDEESQKCLESRDCNNCMDAGPTCLWDLNKQNCYSNGNIFNIPANTAHDKSKCPSKPKNQNNGPQGYGGGPYSPPQQNGGGFGNNGPQNGGGYMNNGPQNGGGFMNNGPQNGGFGNHQQNGGFNNGPQNGGFGGNHGGFNGGGYGGHPQGNMGGGGPQGQGQWGQNNGPQNGFGGHGGGFNQGYGGNPQGNMGGGFGGPQGQGMMGGYGPSQLTVAEFEQKWEDAMAAATPKELKALGVTLDDLEVFDEPIGVTEQVVQGMNYDFEFEDGTHIIVNEQTLMDPPVLKIMEVIPAQPANGGGNGGPPGPGGRPRLSKTHIVDKDESSVNKLLIFTMILWGLVVGIIAGLTISYANEKCYKKTSQEDMYIDLTLDAQQRKV